MNKVILMGRVGRDPEVRYTPGGTAYAKFSMATTEYFKDRKGDRQEKTEWHNCVLWGKSAENLGNLVAKGDKLLVEGKSTTNEWEKDGVKRRDTVVNIQSWELCESKNKGRNQQYNEDDIPF